jgi:3D (Asp-Asp-Asp) domain-containing protein
VQSHSHAGAPLDATMLCNKVSTMPCNKLARQCADCKPAFSSNTTRNMRVAAAGYDAAGSDSSDASTSGYDFNRRQALAALVTVPAILQANAALAVQGLTAGRIPGMRVRQPLAPVSYHVTLQFAASIRGGSIGQVGGLCGCSVLCFALLSDCSSTRSNTAALICIVHAGTVNCLHLIAVLKQNTSN